VLQALGDEDAGLRLSELSRRLGMSKSTLSGLLSTLERFDLVERDPHSRAFRLGIGLLYLAGGFLRRLDAHELARPHLRRLSEASGETAILHLSDGDAVPIADRSEPQRQRLPARQMQLIRSTYRLIGERGVERASLREIAEGAGMSKSLIPYYFKTKENLVVATMRWALSETADRIKLAMAAARTPEEKIVAMVDAIFVEPEANRRFHVAYLDLVGSAARVRRYLELSATFDGIVNSLNADVIRSGVAGGAFEVGDVDEAAVALRALVDGLFVQWLQKDDWRRQHLRYREVCKRAALQLLGAKPSLDEPARGA
jgi:TetR/AcrR family fatty acid metabolism transcriptional regulator